MVEAGSPRSNRRKCEWWRGMEGGGPAVRHESGAGPEGRGRLSTLFRRPAQSRPAWPTGARRRRGAVVDIRFTRRGGARLATPRGRGLRRGTRRSPPPQLESRRTFRDSSIRGSSTPRISRGLPRSAGRGAFGVGGDLRRTGEREFGGFGPSPGTEGAPGERERATGVPPILKRV